MSGTTISTRRRTWWRCASAGCGTRSTGPSKNPSSTLSAARDTSSNGGPRIFRTVTVRLAVRFAALFGALSLAGFLVVYFTLASHLRDRTDRDLGDTVREFEALYDSRGLDALEAEFRREARSRGVGQVFFRLFSPGDEVAASSDLSAWGGLAAGPGNAPDDPGGSPFFRTIAVPGHAGAVRAASGRAGDGRIIQVGTSLAADEGLMRRYRVTFGAALAMMLFLGVGLGWHLARRAMAGVQRATRTAKQIHAGDLGRRVPLGREGKEIEDLALAFNEMLERIEMLVRNTTEVTDNVAHDLRSPLTRIRGLAEADLRRGADGGLDPGVAGAILEECDRLVGLIDTMLEIARADTGIAHLDRGPLDLRRIATEAQDLFLPVAEEEGVTLLLEAPGSPVMVLGDRPRLQRVVANLLDNARKFTPSPGTVTLTVRTEADTAILEVSDTGCGIDEKDLPRIFDRFHRADSSRSTPGSGLGLSLALALVRAHDGEIGVFGREGGGSVFRVTLPLSS